MEELVIGPGVTDAIERANDEPRGNEEYTHDPRSGAVLYSKTQARDAEYRWTPEDGVRRLPFDPA